MFTKKARQALYSLRQSRQSTVCGLAHIKEQSLIQKQPSDLEGCFCIYARKA